MFVLSKFKMWCLKKSLKDKENETEIQISTGKLGAAYDCTGEVNGMNHFEQHHEDNHYGKGEADFETAISAAGFGKFNVLLMLATMPGIMSGVFDTTVVSFIMGPASCELHMSSLDQGILSGIIFAGMMMSAFVWGPLSDFLGRRKLMIVLFACDGLCSLLASISPKFWVLAFFKFLGGFIVSGPSAGQIAFVAEYHSQEHRSRALMLTGIYSSFAFAVMPLMAWFFIPQTWSTTLLFGSINYNGWRLFVTVAALPSWCACAALFFFDESPKFLLAVGRHEEALKVLQRVYRINTGRDTNTYPVKKLIAESKDVTPTVVSGVLISEMHSISPSPIRIFLKQLKPLLSYPNVLKAALICCLQFTGLLAVNTIRLWLPEMFASMQEFSHDNDNYTNSTLTFTICDMLGSISNTQEININGMNNESTGIEPCSMGAMQSETYINALIVGCTATLGYLLGSAIINAVGKRQLIMGGFSICGLCCTMALISTEPRFTVACFAVFIAVGGVSNLAVVSAIVDVFPANVCTMAVSLTLTCGRLGSLIGGTIFPLLLKLDCQLPFYLVCAMSAVTCILSTMLPSEKVSKKI